MSEFHEPVTILVGNTESLLEGTPLAPVQAADTTETAPEVEMPLDHENVQKIGRMLTGQTMTFTDIPEDEAEFAAFARQAHPMLLNVARSFKNNNEQDVEDIVSISLAKAWRKRDTLVNTDDEGLQRWLFRIAKNTSIDRYKAQQREQARQLYADDDDLDNYAASRESAESSYLGNENAQALIDIIREHADPRYEHASRIFELVYLHGYEPKEAAGILDIPPKTVLTRMFRSRKLLKTLLTPDGHLIAAE